MKPLDLSTINNTLYDTPSLISNREQVRINRGNTQPQWEPAVVLDIVLNHDHELFKNGYFGKITPVSEYPENYKGKRADIDDPNYYPIGTILVRLCYTQQTVQKEDLIWAIPFDNSFSTFPVLNEVVYVSRIFDKFFYTNKLNTKNYCNSSADFGYEQTFGKNSGNGEYKDKNEKVRKKYKGPISKLDSYSNEDKNLDDFRGSLGRYFWFNNKIRNLRRFEGDSVFESRFGQSIRMGAYDDNRSNDKGDPKYKDYVSGNENFGGGNPMILIRNRQRKIASDEESDGIHVRLNKIKSVIESPNEKNVNGYLIEDINNDGSSIHITSGLTVSKFRTTCYKSIFSKESIINTVSEFNQGEEQPKFSPENSTNFKFPILSGDQIIIHSDRLIFASRINETLHYSKKRYGIVTDDEFTIDSHDQVVINTNQKTVINSPAIYLGQYNETNEPVLLGQTAIDWLYDLCIWLSTHVHHYEHSHINAGSASPSDTQVPVQLRDLFNLRDKLNTLLSKRVFVTGGGYAPGSDGKEITDGKEPVKINVFNGDGVPGEFKGKNRRESPRKF